MDLLPKPATVHQTGRGLIEAEERSATRRLRQCRDVQSAWRLLQALPSSSLRLNAFHLGAFVAVGTGTGAWREASAAMELLRSRTLPPGLIAQNAVLASLPDWHACIHAFHTQAGDQITRNSIIHGCAKGLHWKGSLHLLATARSLRHHMDAYGFSSAIDAVVDQTCRKPGICLGPCCTRWTLWRNSAWQVQRSYLVLCGSGPWRYSLLWGYISCAKAR